MTFESKHSALVEAFGARFGLPDYRSDEAARAWTRQLAEQFAYSFPGEGWGTKSAGGGRPPSTDVLARLVGGRLWGYDVIPGQGSAGQTLDPRPGAMDLAGQLFIDVTPVNHLGAVPIPPAVQPPYVPPQPSEPPVTPMPTDLTPLLSALTVLTEQQERIAGLLERVNDQLRVSAIRTTDQVDEIRRRLNQRFDVKVRF